MPKANPATVRYPPEELLFGRVIATIANTKTENLQDLLRIEPRIVCATGVGLPNITDDIFVHATADVLTDVINLNAGALYNLERTLPLQLWAKKAYRIWIENKTGGAVNNLKVRDKYLVDELTTVLKLRRGIVLDAEDERLATKFSLRENLAAGRLPYRFPSLADEELLRVIWISKLMTAGANSDEKIGPSITIPENQKVILTEIACEAPDAVTDEVYIKVNRDKDQTDYLEVNVAAMPNSKDFGVPLWVPAVEQMEVRLVCTTAQVGAPAGFRVRYQYVRAPLTLADKVRWNLKMTEEEKILAGSEGLDLFDRIAAGIYPLGV